MKLKFVSNIELFYYYFLIHDGSKSNLLIRYYEIFFNHIAECRMVQHSKLHQLLSYGVKKTSSFFIKLCFDFTQSMSGESKFQYSTIIK
ncbi:hypothetical protein BpHYR1_031114 [Brachionus plicatilis]|uniref:Uncharacterized protein n=1 Tax=Brachionus plicatilis TaxID=10195 RepID=A0A3M7RRT5_BRAPC|nr:hypothetical protein BpHYR1_031114 [Brachionus plicatilis]